MTTHAAHISNHSAQQTTTHILLIIWLLLHFLGRNIFSFKTIVNEISIFLYLYIKVPFYTPVQFYICLSKSNFVYKNICKQGLKYKIFHQKLFKTHPFF